MLTSHWMKAAAIFLWLVTTAWVLSQCDRLLAPADRAKAKPESATHTALAKVPPAYEEVRPELSEQTKQRLEERKAHQEARAKRRVRYRALEADLLAMIKNDLPAALTELAHAASRYRYKLSDLKRLKKADQWERETPVKEAHLRARRLTEEFYRTDLEAQRDREGPTLHEPTDTEDLTKRIAAFKRGGEDIEGFASELPRFYGRVPESLMLSAIDAIPRLVLPKDAFDPCRDPQAASCPKPAPLLPPAPSTLLPSAAAPIFAAGQRYCVDAERLRGDALPIHIQPHPGARRLVNVLSTSCRLTGTGRQSQAGLLLWLEVTHDWGYTGWVDAYFLRRVR